MEIIPTNFTAQFNTRYRIPVRGGVIEAVDVNPQLYQKKDETPIVLAPGWAATIEAYRIPLEEIYKLGRRVLTLSHSREGIDIDPQSGLFHSTDRKSASLQALIDYFKLDHIDLIGHSEGGLIATTIALQKPSRIRNLVLIGSTGILPNDGFVKLVGRFVNEVWGAINGSGTDQEHLDASEGLKALGRYVLDNPSWSFQEVWAIANERITDKIRQLQENGIGVSLINHVNDRLFPMPLLDRDLGKIVSDRNLGGFYSVIGNHTSVFGDPRIARLAINAIDNLEYRRRPNSSRNIQNI